MFTQIRFAGIAIIAVASTASAQVARFENFTEGTTDIALFDTESGISFFDSTSAGRTLVIDVTEASPDRPRTSPGGILTADGFAPGGAFSLSSGFGLTAVLPGVTDQLSFDAIYSTDTGAPGSFDLMLYNEAGDLLASLPQTLAGGNFLEKHIAIPTRSERDLYMFSIANVNGLSIAYDNFSIVPEPSLALIGTIAFAGRRRR